MPGGRRHERAARKRGIGALIGWVIAGFVVAVVCAGVYVGMLALDARDQLQASAGELARVQSSLTASDADHALTTAKDAASSVSASTHRAQSDTHNAVWRAAELLPLLGGNLVAMREASDVAVDASDHAVAPLATLAGHLTPADFTPKGARVDTPVIGSAAGTLSLVSAALGRASSDADAIKASGAIGPVRDAVVTLRTQLHTASEEADAAHRAAKLLPDMLGARGPRDYLLLFQNNAETRSTGGIPGALAVVHVDNGQITLTRQASAAEFGGAADATSILPKSTVALYGDLPGRYMQDVTLPPQFALSGQLARTLWQQATGQQVDGVISVDPIALSYLLKATGPVRVPTGETLTAQNAVKVLLSDSYAKYPVAQQDAFFAGAATSVFRAVTGGSASPSTMLSALARAAGEGRILVWSAHQNEQSSIAETSLAGNLPTSDDGSPRFGVYLNDATGAKMDYYLRATVAVGRAVCRADGKATLAVAVTLTNTAPKDAATSLPAYVTGGGVFGVAPGNVATQIAVYAPQRAAWLGTTVGGENVTAKAAVDGGRAVSRYTMQLAPGESKTVRFDFLADAVGTQTSASGVDRSSGSSSAAMAVVPRELAGNGVDLGVFSGRNDASSAKGISAFVTPLVQGISQKGLSVDCNAAIP
ncbi:DUF4012 domain-containing protein [Planctomonas sp. JC2975]|uniref:DUF4012 domain-containing protein n=1 Tax=Planctomonas sp. JC2975 TaxID=2729626 RepID=UPI001472A3BC|nr:DUF4012 domain-containing protein [Planctomonas sp. JC2975]NNC12961.1 DUF4012 domain-containing protein [Planctomonas sp. JC2975]